MDKFQGYQRDDSHPPESQEVSATILARLFANVTNSYKFLFFLALLEAAERQVFDATRPISLRALSVDMMTIGWYPHVYYRLSFGKADKIGVELDRILPRSILDSTIHPWDRPKIRELISSRLGETDLYRYVPYRLVRPFFPEIIKIKDHEVNDRVAEFCEEYFYTRKPLYRFEQSNEALLLHPDWAKYFSDNLPILRAWAQWQFLNYMQSRNPSVPGIALKLFPPPKRQSLTRQTNFWREVVSATPIVCIYSGSTLSTDGFALDHFIPWSFVVHNQPWNLIPVLPAANSAKNDRLPASEYLDKFIEIQHCGVNTANGLLPRKQWEDYTACYLTDLKIPDYQSVLQSDSLRDAYLSTLSPLMQLARTNGFEGGWRF